MTKRVAWVTATPEDIAHRIGKIFADPPDPTAALLWEAFAEASSNPNAQIIINMLTRFGIQQAWNGLAIESTLTRASIETELTAFLAVRNQAAHSGLSDVVPSPSVIRGYCDLLQKISRGFYQVIRSRFSAPPFSLPLPLAPMLPPTVPVPIFLNAGVIPRVPVINRRTLTGIGRFFKRWLGR